MDQEIKAGVSIQTIDWKRTELDCICFLGKDFRSMHHPSLRNSWTKPGKSSNEHSDVRHLDLRQESGSSRKPRRNPFARKEVTKDAEERDISPPRELTKPYERRNRRMEDKT